MSEKVETWKINNSKKIADCRVFNVREDFCERESDKLKSSFYVIENPNWVNIIALTKENEVVLIEQFRHGIEEIILEIPGGMIDGDEEPEFAAKRELLEETGFSSNEWICLGKSRPNPAIQNNTIYHFLALNCEKTEETSFDEHENVVTKFKKIENVEALMKNGEIVHSLVLTAFYLYSLYNSEN
ncbi:MAG TPA: NUDIX hydrolase [Pyrinomonadaceae bacterium]|nr:NUDIX hydrolase [Pyrinomonadaceae bacterium]